MCTALGVMFCAMAAYLPLSFTPLYGAAFCIYLSFKRGNVVYGLLCVAATVALTFAMSGLSVTFFLFCLIFAPYGILCRAIDKLEYNKLVPAIIRAVIVLVFLNITMYLAYFTIGKLLLSDMGVFSFVNNMGNYALFALVASLIFFPLDVMFLMLSKDRKSVV